jgi:replicative DNA helicase
MSALGERTLVLLLTDTESLETMVKHGVNPVIVPTPFFRDVLAWSMSHYQATQKAPTADVLRERFGADPFTDLQIDLDDDVEETIEWAIGDLEGTWIQQQGGLFTRKMALTLANEAPENRRDALGELASELSAMVLSIQPKTTRMDIRESGPDLLAEYEMAATSDGIRGMRMGIPEIDNHLGGIWPGEMVILGGPAGTGKSFFADLVAHNEWSRGANTSLFTLENSILMTQMRIACCALHLSIEDLQTGNLGQDEEARLREWCNDVLRVSDTPLNIITPDMVNRSPQALVSQARAYETESLIVDQLTHIAPVDPMARDPRNTEVAKILRTFGDLINSGRERLPCLMLHQINREGIKEAANSGRLKMTHFAESSEIERIASVAASLYQSDEEKALGHMEFQMLKQRRVRSKSWVLRWQPWVGLVQTQQEISFDGIMSTEPAPAGSPA